MKHWLLRKMFGAELDSAEEYLENICARLDKDEAGESVPVHCGVCIPSDVLRQIKQQVASNKAVGYGPESVSQYVCDMLSDRLDERDLGQAQGVRFMFDMLGVAR